MIFGIYDGILRLPLTFELPTIVLPIPFFADNRFFLYFSMHGNKHLHKATRSTMTYDDRHNNCRTKAMR